MTGLNTKIRPKILAFVAILLILSVYATSRAAGFSSTAPLQLEIPPVAQGDDPSTPEPVVLTDEQGQYPLGLHLEILEDPSGKLTIEDVSSPEFDFQFTPSKTAVPNYGYTKSVYWVRLPLDNKTSRAGEWLLDIGFVNTQFVDLYTPLPDGKGFGVKQTGFLRPVSTRDVLYPRIIFKLITPTGTKQTYYLRFQNGASMTLPLTLWTQDAFLTQSQQEQMFDWLLFGTILGLLAYHLFLLISLREANYLFFVILLASLFAHTSAYKGYLGVYIFPQLYKIESYNLLAFSLLLVSFMIFSDVFLELKTRHPKFHWVHIGFAASWGVLLLLSPFFSYHSMVSLMNPWSLVTLTVALIIGIACWIKGFHPARFFMAAWLGMLVSYFLVLLVRLGIAPSTAFTESLYQPGLILMAVGWSLALADRINQLKAKTESAYRDLRSSESRLSQILEGMPLGVVVYGKDQKPKYFNKRTVEILGNPAQGIQLDIDAGRTLSQSVEDFSFQVAGTREEYPLENLPVYSALHGQPAAVDDIEANIGDKHVPLEVWASPVMDDEGNVESAVAALQDITQRKQVEAELAEYRKHLETLVEKRTKELSTVNEQLHLHVDWLSAINQVNQTLASSTDFTQIYEKITEVINHLFATQDSFIAELDGHGEQLKILAHSCRSDLHPVLIGSFTTLPESIQTFSNLGQEKLAFISKDQLGAMNGPIGLHNQVAKLQSIVLVPLQLREQVFGFLGLEMEEEGRTITREESDLLSIFSTDIAQLIEDARLFEQSKTLVATEERNRLARDLHDSVAQALYSISLFTDATRMALETNKLEVVKNHLGDLVTLSREAMSNMRLLIFELRPPVLDEVGLEAALQSRLDVVEARVGFQTTFHSEGELKLSPEEESELYWIAQEALNNVIKHAQADQVSVQLKCEAGSFRMTIEDNGAGFDPVIVEQGGGQGIRNIRERAEKIGARYWIESAPGQGTKVNIEVKS